MDHVDPCLGLWWQGRDLKCIGTIAACCIESLDAAPAAHATGMAIGVSPATTVVLAFIGSVLPV